MWHRNPDKEWEKFGKNDPFYGVIVNDKFRKEQINDKAIKDFYKSGSDHIEFIFKTIKNSIDKDFSPISALDFGCGVGRCTLPLALICQRTIGVDVSESMLNEARKKSEEQSIKNIEFLKSDDALSNISGKFDFIHSFATFQLIPLKRGYTFFTRFVELLSDNGVGAIEFVYYREESLLIKTLGRARKNIPLVHNFVNFLYKRPFSEPLMEKNIYNLKKLFLILHKHGCGDLHIKFLNNNDLYNVIIFFKKKQEKVPLLEVLHKN